MHVGLVDLEWDGHHTPYAVFLSRYLTERGHRVTFVTDADNPRVDELPESERLDVHTLAVPKTGFPPDAGLLTSTNEQRVRIRQLRRIFASCTDEDVDVIHLLYFDRTQIPLWIVSRFLDLPPVVATLHRDAFTSSAGATRYATEFALDRCLTTGALSYLTVHADCIRDRIVDAVGAATTINTRTIPAPTPESTMHLSQSDAREHIGLPNGQPLFLLFGELRHEKGPDILAEAMQEVTHPAAAVFAGPEADFTQADVERWQLAVDPPARIVDRIGFVPESELDYYFRAVDALVLPYRRKRGISGPLRRAAMAGTPIIARRDTDVGRLVEAHGLGTTVGEPLVAGLESIIDGFTNETPLADEADLSRFAESRHWTATGAALLELFKEALDDS